MAPLRAAAREGRLTLVFGARDEVHNNAVALKDYLLEAGSDRRGRGAAQGDAGVEGVVSACTDPNEGRDDDVELAR